MTGDMISSDQSQGLSIDILPEGTTRRRGVRATALTAAITLVTTAGVATAIFRSTTSERDPATVIPANAFGVATIHLDLPGGQEQAVDHILGLFPGVNLPGDGSLKDRVMRALTRSSSPPVDYDKDIKPWLGDTATVAGWLDNGKPTMEIVLASTDDAAAREHLPATMDAGQHFEVHDGFAILGNTQTEIDDALQAAATSSLADSGSYATDINALPSTEAATGWLDGAAALKALQSAFAGAPGFSMFGGMLGASGLGGALKARTTVGLHAADDVVQLDLRTVGGPTQFATAPSSLLTQLPSGTIGAFELGDPGGVLDAITPVIRLFGSFAGASISESCTGAVAVAPAPGLTKAQRRRLIRQQFGQTGPHCVTHTTPPVDPFTEVQKALGISFPDDVKTILGDRAVLAYGGIEPLGLPDVAIRSHPTDLNAAQALAQTLATHLERPGFNLSTSTAGDDLVLATTSSYGAEVAKAGTFGDVAQVQEALNGLPSSVSAAFYLDLTRIWPLIGSDVPDGVKHLKAIGVWAGSAGDVSTAQLRVVFG